MAPAACGGEKVSPAADRAAARKANLQASDLPSGWTSRPHEMLPGEEQLRPDIARCLGISPPSSRASAEERSPDFTQGFSTASSIVTFVKSKKEATRDATAFTGGKYADCIRPGYEKQVHDVAPEGNTVKSFAVSKLDLARYGDRSTGDRITATTHIPGPDIDVPINIDLIRIFKGRAEAEIVIVAPGSPFGKDFETRLASAVARRL